MSRRRKYALACFLFPLISILLISCRQAPGMGEETLQTESMSATMPVTTDDSATSEPSETFEPSESSSANQPSIPDTCGKIAAQISTFMSQYRSSVYYDEPTDSFVINIKGSTRDLVGLSTEGGTITRYTDKGGKIYRYRLVLYGETGRMESNYFFTSHFIYYTSLEEDYCVPPIIIGETDILEQTLTEGILIDGVCYRYDRLRDQILMTDVIEFVYTPEELADIYEKAVVSPETAAASEEEIYSQQTSPETAVSLYRELLKDDTMYSLTATADYPMGDGNAVYAFGDCNGDGVPELHIVGGYFYNIYTCRSGKFALLRSSDRYARPLTPLKDGGMIGYKATGLSYDCYYYRRLDFDGFLIDSESRDFLVEFAVDGDPDKNTYTMDGDPCTKEQWENEIAPYRDMLDNPALQLSWDYVFPEAVRAELADSRRD